MDFFPLTWATLWGSGVITSIVAAEGARRGPAILGSFRGFPSGSQGSFGYRAAPGERRPSTGARCRPPGSSGPLVRGVIIRLVPAPSRERAHGATQWIE